MSVKKLKPTTPGRRFRVVNGYDMLTTDKPEKKAFWRQLKDPEVEIIAGK